MSEKQLEKLYYSIYPMNQCETQSKSYEETKELCETLEKEMISLMSPDLQAMFEDYKEYTLLLIRIERRRANCRKKLLRKQSHCRLKLQE